MRNIHSYKIPDPPEAGFQSLANSLIALAFSDLRLALRAEGPAAERRKRECIDFICRDWTSVLTSTDLFLAVKRVVKEESKNTMH